MGLTLRDFMKTAEARQVIESQKIFCCDGMLLQGFKGGPIQVDDTQPSMEELKAVPDRDGSMYKVWFRIAQRLESRSVRKNDEYGRRRRDVRDEKKGLRDAMMADKKELDIDPLPSDVAELKKLDGRLERLQDPALEEAYLYAKAHSVPGGPPVAEVVPEPLPQQECCPQCGDMSPPGKEFKIWLRGHNVGARKKHAELAPKAANG